MADAHTHGPLHFLVAPEPTLPHSERHRPPGGVPPLSPPLSTNFRCCTGWPDGGVGPARKGPSNSGRRGVEGPVRILGSGEGCGKDAANGVAEVGESGAQGERGQCRRLARSPSRLRGGRLPSGTLTEWLNRPPHTNIGFTTAREPQDLDSGEFTLLKTKR